MLLYKQIHAITNLSFFDSKNKTIKFNANRVIKGNNDVGNLV